MEADRYSLYRLCDCTACGGKGKRYLGYPGVRGSGEGRCPDCRGEGRIRQEIATAGTPEAVGVALVTLAREGEWEECPFGLLDRTPPCEECGGEETVPVDMGPFVTRDTCPTCKGSGVKPTGTWLISPWLPSARNVTDAARTLAKSKTRTS